MFRHLNAILRQTIKKKSNTRPTPIFFHVFEPIRTRFPAPDVHKNIMRDNEFPWNRFSQRHTSLNL